LKDEESMSARTRTLLLLLSFLVPPSLLHADGGAVRLVQQQGGYRIAVFTSPVPFRAGPVDVSVLVQDAGTHQPIPDAQVTITLIPRQRPTERITHTATSEAATNKLFRAAVFDLPEPGWWEVEVAVDGKGGPARVHFSLEAGAPPPRWLAVWPWAAWPAAIVVLFCVHQVLLRRRVRHTDCMQKSQQTTARPRALP
jgi:hypothetical protein